MSAADELRSRAALRQARRICVKAGTSVVTNEDGRPSLTRLGAITEQIAELCREGVQVIFVSSGAVGMGKRVLRKQGRMNMSFLELQADTNKSLDESSEHSQQKEMRKASGTFGSLLNLQTAPRPQTQAEKKKYYDSACAAAGQFEMMNLYSSLFDQVDVSASQILVTQQDFVDPHRLNNLSYAVDRLLSLGIVPIVNENDAVSANQGYTSADVFSDNDSLAALCARHFGAEVLLLLTDVDGVYDKSPKDDPTAKLLSFYPSKGTSVEIGEKSAQGRGGMASKIDAAMSAVAPGSSCGACVVAAGSDLNSIRAVLGPKPMPSKGTLFVTPGSELEKQAQSEADQGVSHVDRTLFKYDSRLLTVAHENEPTFTSRILVVFPTKLVQRQQQHAVRRENYRPSPIQFEKIFCVPLRML